MTIKYMADSDSAFEKSSKEKAGSISGRRRKWYEIQALFRKQSPLKIIFSVFERSLFGLRFLFRVRF